MTDFRTRYGPTALITGAARGIGAGFARVLAERGFDLVLTDIDAEGIERTAAEIAANHSSSVSTVALDMTDRAAPEGLADFTSGRDVGLVIINHLFPGGSWQVLDTELG